MNRRNLIRAGGIGAAAAAALAAPALVRSAAAQTAGGHPEIKWRLTSSFPKSLDTIYDAAEFFAKRVAVLTENKFQIRVFAAGEIVPGLQALDSDLAAVHYKPVVEEIAKLDPKDENGIVASFALVRGGQARRDDYRAGAINGLRKRKQRRRKAIRRPQMVGPYPVSNQPGAIQK